MTRAIHPDDPPAGPGIAGQPYMVERRVLAGVPCLLERPPDGQDVRAIAVVYHGAWAAKEGKLGVYSALAAEHGVAVVIPDAPLHGERRGSAPPDLSAREYVWKSVRRSVEEAPELFGAARSVLGEGPIWAIGSSMGGYVAQVLTLARPEVARGAALITSGVWNEPQALRPELRAFVEGHRPVGQARFPHLAPLFLGSGASDPVFPLAEHHTPTVAAYRAAFQQAGRGAWLTDRVFPGVGHYTSRGMRDAVLAVLTV